MEGHVECHFSYYETLLRYIGYQPVKIFGLDVAAICRNQDSLIKPVR